MNKRNYLATIVYDARGADGSSDEMIQNLVKLFVSQMEKLLKWIIKAQRILFTLKVKP